ncbi:MAG: zinc ribbon domain-containing protein [Flavobacteriales bacterium]|nr:zinc ribbon domain-containing protein [Flavobacteriales bacterium]
MFYVYGNSKAHKIRTLDVHHIDCKACESKRTLTLTTFIKYIHIFFIPVATEGKKSVIVCSNCGKEYDVSKQSENVKALAKVEQDQISIPLWHFTGLAILVIILIISLTYDLVENYL